MMDTHHRWNISFKPLIIGFILSLILTLGSYGVLQVPLLSGSTLMATIALMGIVQAFVQLFFFLHVGIESKPRWNLGIFLFMVLLIIVLIGGSLWIMYNLDYHMMPTMSPSE